MADKEGTKKITITTSVVHRGKTYSPTAEGTPTEVEVPDSFPESPKATSEPARPAGSGTGKNTVSGKSLEQLEGMTKEDLVTLAERKSITVAREDGSEGEPLKADYIKALAAASA